MRTNLVATYGLTLILAACGRPQVEQGREGTTPDQTQTQESAVSACPQGDFKTRCSPNDGVCCAAPECAGVDADCGAVSVCPVGDFKTRCSPSDGVCCAAPECAGVDADCGAVTVSSYVSLRRDYRKCIAPACGGYFTQALNQPASAEQYVSRLDFSQSGLSQATIDTLLGAGDGRLIAFGQPGPTEPNFGTSELVVISAYLRQ